jgi:hypothetical protein
LTDKPEVGQASCGPDQGVKELAKAVPAIATAISIEIIFMVNLIFFRGY